MRRIFICVIILFLSSVYSAFAGGSPEVNASMRFTVPLPDPPKSPQLPPVLGNTKDFAKVLTAFDEFIMLMDPVIESLVFNGLEANRKVLTGLRRTTQWWRSYLSTMKIQADSPRLQDDEVDEFLSSLLSKDVQFQNKLDRVNMVLTM